MDSDAWAVCGLVAKSSPTAPHSPHAPPGLLVGAASRCRGSAWGSKSPGRRPATCALLALPVPLARRVLVPAHSPRLRTRRSRGRAPSAAAHGSCGAIPNVLAALAQVSSSKFVREVCEVFLEKLRLVLLEVRDELHKFFQLEPDVDCAWQAWCRAAEVGLLSAYEAAGGPCPQGDQHFLRRGAGGRALGRLHRSAMAGEVDAANCHAFVHSSLAQGYLLSQEALLG